MRKMLIIDGVFVLFSSVYPTRIAWLLVKDDVSTASARVSQRSRFVLVLR
jgi:hypothetical protein